MSGVAAPKSLCYKRLSPVTGIPRRPAASEMASKQPTSADIDWYLVSIDRLKKGGVILLLLALAGGAGWWWFAGQSPRERARRAIGDASSSLNDLASVGDFASVQSDFNRGQTRLQQARDLFSRDDFPGAELAARDAANIATLAMARIPGEGSYDAQFLTVEGEVEFQKGASGAWRRASARDVLFNGDWVKTGGNASAELIFVNGSLYTIGPNALLEIYATLDPATSRRQERVEMQVGSMQINTSEQSSTVRTPGTQVVVSSESTAQVGVGAQKQTDVLTLKGSSAVTPAAGGSAVTVAAGQQLEATSGGELSEVRDVIPPPTPVAPADNQVFQAGAERILELSWRPQPGAAAYRLEVSRSRLFSSLEIDQRIAGTSARTRVTDQGAFYWRLASIDPDGRLGPFTPFRRFRVVGGAGSQGITDKAPPTLQLKRPFRIGGQYYLFEGNVEPGASVFLNDEEIPVESDGSFKKLHTFGKVGWNTVVVRAVDPSGNQTVQRENVYVEE